jgi:hypothetical protein
MPIVALVRLLAVAVGLPFFVVAATSSLVQSWFVRATGGARDPYVLYAAGNFGSLAALVAYPFVIEPLDRACSRAGQPDDGRDDPTLDGDRADPTLVGAPARA